MSRDEAHPWADAWNGFYESGATPWDLGRAHPELERRLSLESSLGTSGPGGVLVPGAGTGHDATAFARAGWSVTALDLAQAVELPLRAALDPYDGAVEIGDALAFETRQPFDLVFDHTFFCAIDPPLRAEFGSMCRRVLKPGGSVVSIVFPIGDPEAGGPPFGFDAEMLDAALGNGFDRGEVSPPFDTPGRRSPHQWATWTFSG